MQYFVILVAVSVSAPGPLQLDAAIDMLAKVMEMLPAIFSAGSLLLSLVIGQIVAELLSHVPAAVGFDELPVRLGLAKTAPKESTHHQPWQASWYSP